MFEHTFISNSRDNSVMIKGLKSGCHTEYNTAEQCKNAFWHCRAEYRCVSESVFLGVKSSNVLFRLTELLTSETIVCYRNMVVWCDSKLFEIHCREVSIWIST